MELVLYTRVGCHLCDEAKGTLAPVLREFGVALKEVDVDTDPGLAQRYGEQVPVLMLDGRKLAKYRIDVAQVRRALELLKKVGLTP
ncbi:MAG TPA: glutaredoxin family protein [Candidatus Xenobia bacterium]|nr:glutaredoxin family protein [Candidatus Xenobia bacterium]